MSCLNKVKGDFLLMKKKYSYDAALTEAHRCLLCDDPPCMGGCPASVNPKKFIRKIRFGDLKGAVRILRSQNVLAGSCAYICPCLSTCGAECTSEKLSSPIDIAGLQRFVMDWEREHGMIKPELQIAKKDQKIAIIGSGPAGLSAAANLASFGYRVEIFEREKYFGGQLRLSIPEFRLPEEVLDFEIEFIKKMGVKFHKKKEIKDISKLKEKFDAVFIAIGLSSSKRLGIAGEEKKDVYDALDFLIRSKKGENLDLGKRVLVVGGGDTAIDSARVAIKHGAQVLMLYRRTQKDMPAYRVDIDEAFSEGVEFWFRVMPVQITGEDNVAGIKVKRVLWKGEGRSVNDYDVEGDEFVIKGDTIINAIGQKRDPILDVDQSLLSEVDGNLKIIDDGVFAGGDYAYGAGTAVQAVGSGKLAAEEIDRYLRGDIAKPVGLAMTGCSSLAKEEAFYNRDYSRLKVNFCGIEFENPFILAAAPPTDELDMIRAGFNAGWAGAVLKTTSMESVNVDLKYPMMSSIECGREKMSGLGNIDLISEYHIDKVEERVRILKEEFPDKKIIVSIMGSKKEDWQSLVMRLSDAGVDMIECSFSCPQGNLGADPGKMLAQNALLAKEVTSWVKEAARNHTRNIPIAIKITPHVTDISEIARAVKEGGADVVTASNTIQSLMGIDLKTWIPNPNVEGLSTYSGLSGPCIKPITLKVISEIAKNVGMPIMGTGGPVTWKDSVEFMLSGAGMVQFCTAVMHYGYDIIEDLKSGMLDYLEEKGLKSPEELIGRSLKYMTSHEGLTYKKRVVSKIDYDKCICDGACAIACRDGGHMAIELDEERRPKVDEEKCVGCGLCKLVCPVDGCIIVASR